ncbi:Ig-like domain repeat protein [Streptacidiphilus monticola]|uniref:Ig-like domain repeat protein n=1 Tax=Streptacidiphilus monticola TaxID=2161674 RepID=A0ABW1G7M4_9ACTN
MRAKRSTALAAAVVTAALAGGSLVSVGTAHADPASGAASGQLVGVGSDTTQDVLNALAADVQRTGGPALASWNATGTATITTRPGGVAFARPNGSGDGRKALTDSLTDSAFGNAAASPVKIGGQVDFARSSGGPGASGTSLTFIPFARDAVDYVAKGSWLQQLSKAQLQGIYNHTITSLDGHPVTPYLPQAGSGTRKFFLSAIGLTESDVTWITDAKQIVEENHGNALITKDASNNDQVADGVIAPFSAASWIAQLNNVSAGVDQTSQAVSLGLTLGQIDLDSTVSGASGTDFEFAATKDAQGVWQTVPAFYSNSTFGRDVYNVVATREINPASAFFKQSLYDYFVTSGSHVALLDSAAAQADIAKYGFQNVSYNGDLTSSHTKPGGLEDSSLQLATPAAAHVSTSAGNGSLGVSWSAGSATAPSDYWVTVTGPDGKPLKDASGNVLSNKDILAGKNALTWSGLASGSYTVTVQAANIVGTADATTVKVAVTAKAATAISYSRPANVAYGYNERITAKVVPAGQAVPTGQVQLLDGARVVGSGTLVKGVAVVNFLNPAYQPGWHSFTLKYLGDAQNQASTTRVGFTIVKATPAERISFPTRVGHTRTSRITVALSSPHASVSGWVSVYDGRKRVGFAKVVGGKAVVTVARLGRGTHKLRIAYSGNSVLNATSRWVTVKSV